MSIFLGIDTGGTYTDAVLFDDADGVITSTKALTTKHDLSIGIREAFDAVLTDPLPDIQLVSLSTTLATNAVVEGRRSPIALLLLGYHPDALKQSGLSRALGSDPVIFIDGGHKARGEEQMPLDLEAAREAILTYASQVSAFAISGYFSVRNPKHELAVKALVRELTDLPVSCGHELTSNLDAPRRAVTVALNARLIPLLQQLILAVQGMLDEKNIDAPLMVVQGDGSLMKAEMALERPIETVLSGPAASVVGAKQLATEDNVFVVDMGGTTTDIALLRDGQPVLDKAGAVVGGWQTMVEAVAIYTVGLGGDSEVRIDEQEGVVVGPQRVVPVSLLAHQDPKILEILQEQMKEPVIDRFAGRFIMRQQGGTATDHRLSRAQSEIWDRLQEGPIPMHDLVENRLLKRGMERLLKRGLVIASSLTPSDAAHVLGLQKHWEPEAAKLGTALWIRHLDRKATGSPKEIEQFCHKIIDQVVVQSGRALVASALAETDQLNLDDYASIRRVLVDRAMTSLREADPLIELKLYMHRPIVAIGGPVQTYYPQVAEHLHTRLVIPPHAEIANAVGAVAGGIMQRIEGLIRPVGEDIFRVHLPTGNTDFRDLTKADEYVTVEVSKLAKLEAERAGAGEIQVKISRKDVIVPVSDGEEMLVEIVVRATATGRPRLGK